MKKVAILVTNGYQYDELVEPHKALASAGHEVHVVSPAEGAIKPDGDGESVTVDVVLRDASADQYDALVLPGGVHNPDTLRTDADAVSFVRHFVDANKPIAAICHGPWTLINADGVAGKQVTSWPSLQIDLENAGAEWVDKEVVVDGTLVTSRNPGDLPAFNEAFMQVLS